MACYLILGAGKFGRLAVERLSRQDTEAKFLVVDRDPGALAGIKVLNPEVMTVEADAGRFLAEQLREKSPWDWVIPMTPVHAAYAWLRQGPLAGDWQPAAVPEAAAESAPVAMRGQAGELYLSYAQHRCPDDCLEPDVCPVSGEPRGTPLDEALAALRLPDYRTLVLVSRQLAPGVGGFPPGELLKLAEKAESCPKVLIATACRCHGVVHALERRRFKR
jgi:hypothetical protein